MNDEIKIIQKKNKKKQSNVIINCCTAEMLRAKISLSSKQTTKIHKTKVKLL